MLRNSLALFVITLQLSTLVAQGTQADYDRASGLAQRFQGKVLNARPKIVWQGDGKHIVYRQQREDDRQAFLRIDILDGTRSEAFDHQRLAADLSVFLKKPVDPEKLPFSEIEVNEDGSQIFFRLEGTRWQYDRFTGAFARKPAGFQNDQPRPRRQSGQRDSADGQWRLSIKDFNVVLINRKTQAEEKLTKDGTAAEPYVEQFYWTPNSKKAIFLKVKPAQEHKVYLIESSPSSQVQPKLHESQYLKPGDEVAKPTLFLLDVPTKQIIKINNKLFPNPYYLADHSWDKDNSRFTFQYNQRGHQAYRWLAADADTGHVTSIIDEQSKTFIDYAGKFYLHQVDGKP